MNYRDRRYSSPHRSRSNTRSPDLYDGYRSHSYSGLSRSQREDEHRREIARLEAKMEEYKDKYATEKKNVRELQRQNGAQKAKLEDLKGRLKTLVKIL